MSEPTKKDGRSANGCKPGEPRKGQYPESRKRVKWSHHFSPEHFAAIKATGRPIAHVVGDALTLYFSQEKNKENTKGDSLIK